MARVALLSPSVVDGDAVGNDLLGMHRILSARGHEVRVFAADWGIREPRVFPLSRASRWLADPRALAVYHHSIGWGGGLDLLSRARCRRVVKYHNVTPPEFFQGLNQDYVNVCREGRLQLGALARLGCEGYLADSDFNLRELLEAGIGPERGRVVPPFHHADLLSEVDPDPSVLERFVDGRTNLLTVGRVSPNKGHAALLKTLAIVRRRYDPGCRLLIVGKSDPRFGPYNDGLRELADRLGVGEGVVFAGGVSAAALKAYYLAAHVFLMASEHEGFCVPIIEAMSLGLPVVAYAAAAVPGTVGGAGLVWEERSPELLAASIDRIVRDGEARRLLEEAGLGRYRAAFTNEGIASQFLDALAPWIGGAG